MPSNIFLPFLELPTELEDFGQDDGMLAYVLCAAKLRDQKESLERETERVNKELEKVRVLIGRCEKRIPVS